MESIEQELDRLNSALRRLRAKAHGPLPQGLKSHMDRAQDYLAAATSIAKHNQRKAA